VDDNVRFVALGDSYTAGLGLPDRGDRWPNQLRRALRPEFDLGVPENLAENSASTIEVIETQLPRLTQFDPDLVSLQVGINDVIPRPDASRYRKNLDVIFDAILERVPASRVVVVTIPDFSLTPKGGIFAEDPQDGAAIARLRADINRFNALLRAAATARGIAVVDISPVSNLVAQNPALLLDDEAHPSALQYAGWVELIAPVVRRLLRGEPAAEPTPEPTPVPTPVLG
jgi:lysophospholipase L1-like esterase